MANVIFEIVLIIILIVLTGILSMAELAVVSTKKAKLEKLLNEGHKSAQIIIDFAEDPNQFLSTVQIGITLIGILTGAYGGATLAEPLSEVIGPYVPYSGTISILVVVIITTYLTLVIGEIVPKVIALNNPEKVSLKLAKSMSVLSKVCKPISAVLAKSTDFVLWTIGMKSKSESIVTEEEIELLIEEGREDGTIEKEEEDIIKRVFKLDDKKVESIMTPRNEIIWVDLEDDKRANEIKIMESKRSIFPIAKGELDDFIGVVQAKDILALLFSEEKFDINSILSLIHISEPTRHAQISYAVRRRCRRRGCGCIGRFGTALVVHAVAGVAGDVAVSEPSRQRLVKGAQIVERTLAVITANGESAVFGFLGDGVLEHDHRGDLERPAHGVRNVVAFYAQRCLSEPECLRDVVHGRGARTHVADAAHLAALQRLPGVLVRPVHQRLLLAAACHADGDHGATQPAQP